MVQLPPGAQRIAPVRRLDLDHIRAEPGEEHAGERSGQELPELEDCQAAQRPR